MVGLLKDAAHFVTFATFKAIKETRSYLCPLATDFRGRFVVAIYWLSGTKV